ncbi:MAG: polysaccharide biosynthesis tyrosine autokinase [Actinobacteria bacterium]|nr:polysaccharide biosynthesis tyrosine autokinase [Actinomycetota bacterium]
MTEPTTGSESRTSGFELRDYFRILWLRKWTAILVLTLIVTSALFLSYQQTPIFESQATVLVPPNLAISETGNVESATKVDSITESQLAQSTLIGFYASELVAGCPVSGFSFVSQDGRLEAEEPTASPSPAASPKGGASPAPPVVENAAGEPLARDPNPEVSANKALALSAAYLGYKRELAIATAKTALAQVQTQIALYVQQRTDIVNTAQAAGVTPNTTQVDANINALKAQEQIIDQAIDEAGRAGDIINPPVIPKTAALPNHIRDGLFAFIIGLILGVGAAFLRDYVDDSLKGVEDVERQSGAPLIGVVPHVPAARGIGEHAGRNGKRSYLVTLDDPKAPSSEAYRTLRTNLLFMSVSGPVGKLLVTSPVAGEGKTTSAANLAVVLAQAGQRVLLVGSDLRRPSVHRHFGVSNRVGLSSVLSGQASLLDAVNDPGIRGLRVMSGGPVPPNPTELLGSLAMKDFLDQAAQVTDWVILDAPPVLGLADAAVLATLCDATLFVVNETTNRRVLAHARDQLAKVRARVVGTVLNNFGPAFSYYYSDYYAYTSQYYLAEPEPGANGKLSRRERKRQAAEDARGVSDAGFESETDGRSIPQDRTAR